MLLQRIKKLNQQRSFLPRPLNHPHVADATVLNLEFQHGAHFVETSNPGRARIEMKPPPGSDFLYEQNVAVAAYKQIGWVGFQLGQHALGIAWGAPADVGHPNLHPSSNKVRVFRVRPPRDVIVDVAKDGPARRHFGQGICHVERPYVTCMPHFIRPFNMPQDPRVNVPVRVRKEGDVHGKGRCSGRPG